MQEQIIIALSGRKGSGKNTLAKFIGRYFVENYVKFEIPPDALDEDVIKRYVFECSFADDLKRFCIETLGLSHESCYGSDEQKNAPTQYLWENTSKFLRWKFGGDPIANKLIADGWQVDRLMDVYYHRSLTLVPDRDRLKSGPMSGRDIMQLFGTDLIRQTFGNIWAAATIRSIKRRGFPLSIITDNRFPNEIKAVLAEPKGYIIRLTRSPFGFEDIHPSESALDDYNWEQERHYVLNNTSLSIKEQNIEVVNILDKILGSSR